jgi:hypothetical protein
MKHHVASRLLFLVSALVLLFSASLSITPHSAVAQGNNPTPGVKLSTPQAGSTAIPTPQKPEVSDNSDRVKPSVTFDELLKKYPTLKAYLDKLDAITSDEFYKAVDYKELYQQLAIIYKDYGSTGVSVFLDESYLSQDLDVPLTFFDLVMRFEDGGFDKIAEQAKKEDLIENDELVAYLAVYPPEQLDALKSALKKAGVSAYDFDDKDEVLDIGIPLQALHDLKTPDAMLQFLAAVGNMDGVDEFIAPETELQAAQSK